MERGRNSSEGIDVIIGQHIRVFRRQARLSRVRFADRIGIAVRELNQYEEGSRRVGPSLMVDIAAELNMPVIEFFRGLAIERSAGPKHNLTRHLGVHFQ